jgi:cell division transport system ATP-binding protein
MITFDHVTKIFGNGTLALDDVSFHIEAGEFVILEGTSGAGKTTMMRLMLKEFTPTRGLITIDGDDLSKITKRNIPFLRRKIGVVFQDFKILMDRTVTENIELALDILGLDRHIMESRMYELLKLTGLAEKANDFPVQLSGGQLQRVIIARALAGQPKILFADEPTGNLDAETALSIIDLLKDINEQGTTVVMSTHDVDLVKDLHARTLRLDKGKLVKDSKSHHKEAAHHHASERVEEVKLDEGEKHGQK